MFEPWNARTIDPLFRFRNASASLRPPYDSTIVHLDISHSTIQQFPWINVNRSHFARVVRNLTAMDVSAQLYDFIFPAGSEATHDRALIDATNAAGQVYYGYL